MSYRTPMSGRACTDEVVAERKVQFVSVRVLSVDHGTFRVADTASLYSRMPLGAPQVDGSRSEAQTFVSPEESRMVPAAPE
jgi:hypothetical protein